jgi:hypothetical protein
VYEQCGRLEMKKKLFLNGRIERKQIFCMVELKQKFLFSYGRDKTKMLVF